MITAIFVVFCCLLSVIAANDIFGAVAKSDVASLARIVAAEPDQLNKIGSGGQTPLMNAVLSGKTKSVEFLLGAGADVTIPEQDGYTPMVHLPNSPFPQNWPYQQLPTLPNSTELAFREGLRLRSF